MAVLAQLERVPTHRISQQAREVEVGKVLLTVLAALFYAIGWVPSKLVLAIVWALTAVRLGWTEARRPPAGSG